MRILITGGAGFIGSNLALHFSRACPSAAIVCMDNLYRRGSELNVPRLQKAGVRFHRGDVGDPDSFPTDPFDFIVECSAEPSVLAGENGSPEYVFKTNLVGAYQCLEKARLWGSKFLFLSTSRIYPIAHLEAHPWREEKTRFVWEDKGTNGITSRGVTEGIDLNGARSLYGFTKFAAEQLIEEYRAAYGIKAVVDRCSVVAGPWQFGKVDQGVASLWVLAHHLDRRLSYIGYGGMGKQVRDILHIDDLCELICDQLMNFDQWEGWVGNVSGGVDNAISLCELTELCREITGKEIAISSVAADRPNDVRILVADSSRLFQRTTWRPKRDLHCIVQDISNWVCGNRDALEQLLPVST
jgi:CDP-paratose 2-epimerase